MTRVLDSIPIPINWESRRFGRIVRRSKEADRSDLQPLSVFLDEGVVPRASRSDNHNQLGEDMSKYLVVRPGDVVFNKLRTWQGGFGISRHEGVVSPAYFVCRPQEFIDARFIDYLLHSHPYISELTRVSKFMPPAQFDILWDDLKEIPILSPSFNVQQAIADYLDTETARIDALVFKKQRMIGLLVERRKTFVSKAMTIGLDDQAVLAPIESEFSPELPRDWDLQRLRNVVIRIIDTAHKTAPVVDGGPYLVVRTSNVKQGRLVFNDARYTDAETWQEWTLRGVPQPGDVMFTREAPAGEACVVPEGLPLCIGQRMVLLQVDQEKIYGEWLMHSIYSGPAQRFIELLSNSTTVAHLNMSDIPDIPVTVPPLAEQARILEVVRRHIEREDYMVSRLVEQVSLLQERRQALITAAVTGQLDIPEVAA